ncbi:hypothetical protein COCCADRAFT_94243 [Bipolaris zeicola 26-R-13]|uniref:Uncharacterized protein n=1 Tax=Cochliobolus carbonum (strain 26-R-13) TaxID=930089 RepID=W6Y9D9_COCC2|nr:uncharacterized protein COCCADRAFT_94243 [Bipolaris zeicola 26-R-13]EUC34140.1 hypothetical protein COCCADRAFT_94243 [Bipolaris zeicola 26-R-13]
MRNSGATWFTDSSVYQAVGTERMRANQAQIHGSRWCGCLYDSSHDEMARWERESHRTLVGSASLASATAALFRSQSHHTKLRVVSVSLFSPNALEKTPQYCFCCPFHLPASPSEPHLVKSIRV